MVNELRVVLKGLRHMVGRNLMVCTRIQELIRLGDDRKMPTSHRSPDTAILLHWENSLNMLM